MSPTYTPTAAHAGRRLRKVARPCSATHSIDTSNFRQQSMVLCHQQQHQQMMINQRQKQHQQMGKAFPQMQHEYRSVNLEAPESKKLCVEEIRRYQHLLRGFTTIGQTCGYCMYQNLRPGPFKTFLVVDSSFCSYPSALIVQNSFYCNSYNHNIFWSTSYIFRIICCKDEASIMDILCDIVCNCSLVWLIVLIVWRMMIND